MKMIRLSHILLCLFLPVVCNIACDTVHEFPEETPIEIDMIQVSIEMDLNMDFHSDTIFQTYTRMLGGDYDIRYIVDIYEADASKPNALVNKVKRIVKTENTVISKGIYHINETVQIPIGKYKIVAWIDFVEKGTSSDKHYETTDLQKIVVKTDNEGNRGYNTTKDAFTGSHIMDLTPYKGQGSVNYTATVATKRPFAVYQIITTDVEKYNTRQQTSSHSSISLNMTNLYYNLFFPTGYNVHLFAPDSFETNINYNYNIIESTPNKEAIIASDIVFVEDDTFYSVDFDVISAEGKHISTIKGLRINLERNKLTIIRAEFLTKDLDPNNDGGIGIDDKFEEEIIIFI